MNGSYIKVKAQRDALSDAMVALLEMVEEIDPEQGPYAESTVVTDARNALAKARGES